MHERPSYSKHARSQHGRLLSLPTDLQVLLQDSTHGHPPTHDESKSGGLRGLCSNSSVLFEMEPEGFGHHGASGSVQSLNASLSPFQRPLIQHQASFSSSVLNSIIINGGPVHGRASIPAQSAISEHPPPLLSRPAECLLSLCLPYDDLSHLLVQQLRRLRPIAGGTTSQSVEDLATDLLSLGYLIQARDGGTSSSSSSGGVGKKAQEAPQGGGVQQANARAANSLRSLRHCFLVCTGWHQTSGSREAVLLEEPLIVEPRFKEQFLIANPTRAYEELLQAVPISFVGNLGRLRAAVQILGSEIAEAFRQQNRSLPPWRTPEALLSKWAPAQMEDLRKLMQHAASMPPPVTAHYERPPTPHLGTAASVSQFHTASSLTNFPCYRALAKQSAAGRRPGCGGVMCNGVTFQEVQGQQQGCPALSQHGEEGLGQLGLTAAALPLQVLPLLPQELKGVFGSEAKRRPTHSRNSSLGRALQPCSSSSSSIPNFDLQGAPLESCSCPSDSHAAALAGAGGGGGYIQGAGGGDSMVCNDCDGGIAAADAGVGAHNNGSNAGSADPSDCHCGRGDILEGCSGSRGGSNGSGGSSSGKDSDNKCHTARQSKGVNLAKGLGLMRSSSSSLNLKDGVHGTGGDAAMFRLCQQQQRSILRAPTSRMSMPIWQSQELSPSGQASCTLSVMRSQDLNAHGAVEGPSQASPVAKHDTHGFADVIECPSQTGVVANQGSHGPAHVEGPSQAGAVANHDSCRLANVALKAGHKAAGVSAAEEQQQQQQQQREEESANGGGVVEISSSNSSSSLYVACSSSSSSSNNTLSLQVSQTNSAKPRRWAECRRV
mmetsp:Transcript_11354/g.30959  ORF Transcript_11354/g.30959 Transcript_11354/m.30959 type:complete len:831 (+) Transcript_11354:1166-3658(+)